MNAFHSWGLGTATVVGRICLETKSRRLSATEVFDEVLGYSSGGDSVGILHTQSRLSQEPAGWSNSTTQLSIVFMHCLTVCVGIADFASAGTFGVASAVHDVLHHQSCHSLAAYAAVLRLDHATQAEQPSKVCEAQRHDGHTRPHRQEQPHHVARTVEDGLAAVSHSRSPLETCDLRLAMGPASELENASSRSLLPATVLVIRRLSMTPLMSFA